MTKKLKLSVGVALATVTLAGAISFSVIDVKKYIDNPAPLEITTEQHYVKHVWESNFDTKFRESALKGVKWDEDGVAWILPGGFEGAKIPGDFRLPSKIGGIGALAFNNTKIGKGFKLPLDISNIDEKAFFGAGFADDFELVEWSMLTNLRDGGYKSTTYLNMSEDFIVPEDITVIPNAFFSYIKTSMSFVIPETITDIGELAFQNTYLENGFTIGSNDININSTAFLNTVMGDDFVVKDFKTLNGLQKGGHSQTNKLKLADDFRVSEEDYELVSDNTFTHVELRDGFRIADYWTLKGIRKGSLDFSQNMILADDWTIPSDVEVIENDLFMHVTLNQSFMIPSTVLSVSQTTFHKAILPDNFLVQNWWTFQGFKNGALSAIYPMVLSRNFDVPTIGTEIPENSFSNVTLEEGFVVRNWETMSCLRLGGLDLSIHLEITSDFTYPDNATVIENSGFENTTLPDNFTISENITTIGVNAFKNTRLPMNFKVPSSVTTISQNAFMSSILPSDFKVKDYYTLVALRKGGYPETNKLTLADDFTLPVGLTEITNDAFYNTILNATFSIPNSVVSISVNAFENATLNSNFMLPSSIKFIGSKAFAGANLPLLFTVPDADVMFNSFVNATFLNGYIVEDFYTLRALRKGGSTASLTLKNSATIPETITIDELILDNAIFNNVSYKGNPISIGNPIPWGQQNWPQQ